MKTNREIKAYGIDASRYNKINFSILKEKHPEISFVMLRIGGTEDREYEDIDFFNKYKEAKKAGFHIGIYYMLPTKVNASEQFLHILTLLNKYRPELDYPIALDCELHKSVDKTHNSKHIAMLGHMLEKCGYYVMIYSNPYFFENVLSYEALKAFDLWVAAWSDTESPKFQGGMWQYTSSGKLNGINGDIDCNVAFKDFPPLIKTVRNKSLFKIN